MATDKYIQDDSRLSSDGQPDGGYDEPIVTLTLEEMAESDNIAKHINKNELANIGCCLQGYFEDDYNARGDLNRNLKEEAELVTLISRHKTYPFEGASNVSIPVATVAVLQYTARAAAAIYNNGRLVSANLPSGADKRDPKKKVACKAVEKDIAFELLNKLPDWDEGMRKVFMCQATSGNVYKKIYFNTSTRRVQADVVYADKLVFASKTHTIATSPRISEIVEYTPNDVFTKVAAKEWVKLPAQDETEQSRQSEIDEAIDRRHGQDMAPETEVDPKHFIEMYTFYDLDKDGYQEPVIVTFRRSDGAVARIVANFSLEDIHRDKDGNLLSITREVTFVKYGFIPSPNNSIYDFGFGRLMLGINKAINTSTNLILDTAKWHAAGGAGYIDTRLSGQTQGRNKFAPGEYKTCKMMDIDMNKAIWSVPLPSVPPELMAMINFLTSYADRIAGSTEARSGENPGQNTKVGTMEAVLEEGAAIFNGIYRSTRKSFCDELRAIFRLKKRYFDHLDRSDDEKEIASQSQYDMISDIDPACPLQYVSERDKLKKATLAIQTSTVAPQGHNMYNILEDFYDAQDPDLAERYLIHDPKSPNGLPSSPDPKSQIEQGKLQMKGQELQIKSQQAQQEAQQSQQEMQLTAMELQSEIELKKAQAIQILSSIEDAKIGHKIALLDAIIGLGKHKDEHSLKLMELINDSAGSSGVGGEPGSEAPTTADTDADGA